MIKQVTLYKIFVDIISKLFLNIHRVYSFFENDLILYLSGIHYFAFKNRPSNLHVNLRESNGPHCKLVLLSDSPTESAHFAM